MRSFSERGITRSMGRVALQKMHRELQGGAMTAEKKYVKRIGWVVQVRDSIKDKWILVAHSFGTTKEYATHEANRRDISFKRDLARYVPVYVEVSHAD